MSTLREVQVVIEHDATASNASGRQGTERAGVPLDSDPLIYSE